MAGITDATNLAQKGIYKELQTVPGGGDVGRELLDPPARILSGRRRDNKNLEFGIWNA